jgi:hypothetical protein
VNEYPNGRSLPIVLLLVMILAGAAYFVGWEIPVAAAAVAAMITAGIWINDTVSHNRKCPECAAAKAHLLESHPEWLTWIDARSHRANLAEEAIVAVFYQDPDRPAKPASYKLFAVEHGNCFVSELDRSRFGEYCIRDYK